MWQPLWLLAQAAQPLEWALDPVQWTSNPPGLTEPWSSHSSDLPPESPHEITPSAESGGFNYLSSSPDQMLALPHHELTETLVPQPDTDSAAELFAGPDQFAVPHQDLSDKVTQQQKLPAAAPVLDWEQNQTLVLPFRYKSKTKTTGLDQAEGHQSFEILVPLLGSKNSKPTKFIVSPPNLKKDLVQHRQLAKVVAGTTGQLETETQGLEQQLQNDCVDSGMDTIYPEESLPTDFLGNSEQPPEPPEEAEISASQQEAQLRHPETPEVVESFSPQAEVQDETAEPTEEVEPPPLQQEPPSQPLELPQEFEPSLLHQETPTQAPGYPTEYVLESPVTLKPLDLELTIIPTPTTEAERSTVLQQSAVPAAYPEVTIASPEQVQLPHPTLTEVTVQPLDLEITFTPESSVEAEPSPTMGQPQAQPPEEVVAQSPSHPEVPLPAPDQDHAKSPTSPRVTVKPLDLEPTITPEPSMESGYSTALPQTPAPPPKHPEVTLAQPTLTQVTVTPVDLGGTTSQQPSPSETVLLFSTQDSVSTGLPGVNYTPQKKQPEQNVTTDINMCELCTCKDETLSCVGLSPKQKLHRVPEPQPNTYKGIFTTVNFQGNSMSYIDENVWKAYRWTETLILSENHLTELHKDSSEGLLSLQYLDLSCNKIQSIERRTFEPLPFLQFINLGCNLLTDLSFGKFQAWHGMQFLHKL
ncbi:leucine-rich repeat-containing protein 37B-like [Hippopotamus amphibius kiboko]|uniref:leucine-rich repeat-containing protein 37B-like n=1 Tax=Hippopotamus amphibius kiboko TaxID=575201 RepID=UPI0025988D9F|nr:leucine-rich repeat-containing protein 37B-like [Hippopotamus amphibius kiboko]